MRPLERPTIVSFLRGTTTLPKPLKTAFWKFSMLARTGADGGLPSAFKRLAETRPHFLADIVVGVAVVGWQMSRALAPSAAVTALKLAAEEQLALPSSTVPLQSSST